MIKVLDVCSGIGGFSLGLEATGSFETVAFCEVDKFCCKVLNKHWPNVPIYDDLKELGNEPERIIQDFDLLCGGIPCQPFSQAGNRKGKEDDRHLWPYVFEIIKSKKPTWVIIENVAGFVNMALDDVCLDLENQNYSTQPYVIPACGIEAPHRRDRVWIIGKLMVDSKCDKHIGEVGGVSKEKGKDEKRHGEEHSSTRISSGTSEVRPSNNGHEGGEVMANSEGNGKDGIRREAKSEYDQGNARMESKCSSNGQSKQEPSQEMANSESDRLLSRNGGLCDGNGNGLLSNEERNGSEVRGKVSGRSRLRTKENVADPNDNGHERGFSKTCNENVTGQDTQSIRTTDTKDSSRQGYDGRDPQEPRVDGTLSRSSDGREASSARATGVCEVYEKSNNNQGTSREDRHQEDNNRTLVQERHEGIQSSVNRELGDNQASLKGSKVRQGNDDNQINRVGKEKDVADSECEGLERQHELSSTKRGENKGLLSGTEGSSRTNEDVANSSSSRSFGESKRNSRSLGEESSKEKRTRNQSSVRSEACSTESARENATDPSSEGLQGTEQHETLDRETETSRTIAQSFKNDGSQWAVEPNVGRVADGIPNRVDRLKSLGNAIVPQIIYQIGVAIAKEDASA